MKFYISNDIKFMRGIREMVGSPDAATHMKSTAAVAFTERNPGYECYKLRKSSGDRDYVICTPQKYIAEDKTLVGNMGKAKSFATAEDAYAYIHENSWVAKLLPGFRVINEKFKQYKDPALELKKVVSKPEPAGTSSTLTNKRILFSREKREEIYKKSGGVCALCGKQMSYAEFTIDHIIPLSRGGTNEDGNLRGVHKRCNRVKGYYTDDELHQTAGDIMASHYMSGGADALNVIRAIVRGTIGGYGYVL